MENNYKAKQPNLSQQKNYRTIKKCNSNTTKAVFCDDLRENKRCMAKFPLIKCMCVCGGGLLTDRIPIENFYVVGQNQTSVSQTLRT